MSENDGMIEGPSGNKIAGPKKWATGYDVTSEERKDLLPAKDFVLLLQEKGVIPDGQKISSDFKLIGTCSAIGTYEEAIAHHLDKQIDQAKVSVRPTIIATDYAHHVIPDEKGEMHLRTPNISFPRDLKNVNFEFHAADATRLPITGNSANVIFENLGGIFYANPDKLRTILNEYRRVLKTDGRIVVSKASFESMNARYEKEVGEILKEWNPNEISKDHWNFVVLHKPSSA